ncbi:MAG: outer membrane beta-barrel protein [Planctomycetes bacterium]|nr:outer membrane beta-barrel protein [Planctomycetota bacterium]
MRFARVLAAFAACALSSCVVVTPEWAYDPELVVRGTVELGTQRMRDDGYWTPTDEPFAISGLVDVRDRESGFGGEFGAGLAFDDADVGTTGTDAELSMGELFGGARQTFSLLGDRLHPYVAFGAAVVTVTARLTQGGWVYDEDDDASFGLYARVGAYWNFGGGFDLGVDLRRVFATDVELAGAGGDVDSSRLAIVFGWSI